MVSKRTASALSPEARSAGSPPSDTSTTRRGRRRNYSSGRPCVAALMSAMLVLAAGSAFAAPSQASVVRGSGDVDVLSAGSLDTLMTKAIGPAFHKATGYTLVDTSGGSSTLAADIKNKVDVADVFVSASPTVNTTLEGKKNGGWVSWYASFASSPVVLGYYPKSTFAKDLKTMPWYRVIAMPGFRLGRTDPSEDPGGVLAAKALQETARAQKLPRLRSSPRRRLTSIQRTPSKRAFRTGSLTHRSCTKPTPIRREAHL